MFAINAVTGELTTLGDINFEFLKTYPLELRVTDLGGLHDTVVARVDVVNVNEPPTILPGQVFTASEGWGTGAAVGVVSATDPDADTQFVFNIMSGNLGAAFAVDPATGVVTVSWDGALDYENIVVYSVNVGGLPPLATPLPQRSPSLAHVSRVSTAQLDAPLAWVGLLGTPSLSSLSMHLFPPTTQ